MEYQHCILDTHKEGELTNRNMNIPYENSNKNVIKKGN